MSAVLSSFFNYCLLWMIDCSLQGRTRIKGDLKEC